MNFLNTLKARAREKQRTIVLPEGNDERVRRAASEIVKQKVAKIILLGNPSKINISGNGLRVVDPESSEKKKDFIEAYYELRKNKESREYAESVMDNPLYFGCMLVRKGEADGMVGGAVNNTADVVRAAIRIIGVKKNCSVMSSFFIMKVPNVKCGEDGCFLFADCGVVPEPSAEQLADIAVSTASSARELFNWTPRVAMLSYSTKGSAQGVSVEKVKKAVDIARSRENGLMIDGEVQLDAAIVPDVAKEKKAHEVLSGNANILIFPDLNSGNISYKIVQRLAGAEATGPVFQGLAKPVNDLSRGCSVEDIVNSVAVTAVQ